MVLDRASSLSSFAILLGAVSCALACAGCSGSDSTGVSSGQPSSSSSGSTGDASASGDCPSVAKAICAKAGQCSGTGAPVKVHLVAGSGISYESESYCEGVFTKQCGPSSPASDVPRVADPAACASAIAAASCDGDTNALLLPAACGGGG
jgi:hypothetical protein